MRCVQRRRKGPAAAGRPKRENYGDLITADHLTRRGEANKLDDPDGVFFDTSPNFQNGLVISDDATELLGFYPQVHRTKVATTHGFCIFKVSVKFAGCTATAQANSSSLATT